MKYNQIDTGAYTIYFAEEGYKYLADYIKEKKYSKIFVLSDTHTHECCVYTFLQKFPFEVEIIEVEAGEECKTLDTCLSLWQTLSDLEADRKSLLINVGGGVVTDMGGFVASTFKRGIDFINIPTSLLAMVDASIGGKTGVDLGTLKNQIGVIENPKLLLIDVNYLNTLPKEEFRSGLAEMFKHGLIQSPAYWEKMRHLSTLTTDDLEEIIYQSNYNGRITLNLHPFIAAYLTKGIFSIRFKWFLKYKRWVSILPRDAYSYLEYRFKTKEGTPL